MTAGLRRASAVIVLGLSALGISGLASCSDSADTSDDSTITTRSPAVTGDPAAAATVPSPATSVPEALDFRAPLVGGGEFDGAAYAGRPVLFWFWAPT